MQVHPVTAASEPLLGYVGQVIEGGSHQGGLLVVTLEGDPVDFVYTTPVSLTHLQRILLGKRADAYLVAKVLSRPLWDKVQEKPTLLCFDDTSLLGRTVSLPVPVVVLAAKAAARKQGEWHWHAFEGGPVEEGAWLQAAAVGQVWPLLTKARTTMAPIDLSEPFRQVRDALAEVRKDGSPR